MGTTHHVAVDLNTLMNVVDELCSNDPPDYADLPIDETELRQACCEGALRVLQHAAELKADEFVYMMLGAITKLLEENALLYAKQMQRAGLNQEDLEALLTRMRGSSM